MASILSPGLPQLFHHLKPFELEGRSKFKANGIYTLKNSEKEQENYGLSQSYFSGALFTLSSSPRVTLSRWLLLRAFSSTASSADSDKTNSENEAHVAPAHNCHMDFNRVNCLVWVLHESARSFSLAVQTLELARSGPELSMAWVGVDVHAWHKRIAYQVAVYALLKAVIEVEIFLSQKRISSLSTVHEILSPKTNYLGECIESHLDARHPKLVQWFRTVELPRIAGLFIPLFKKWSIEYARSGVAGIVLAISCCAAVRKLGSGRLSCPLFSVSIEDVIVELMDLSHSLVSVGKLHHLATEAGFEEDFLLHFGTKVLPGKNIDDVEFWIGLVQKKLTIAFHRESVTSGKRAFCDKVQVNSLATLGLFAFLGRETRLFLSGMNIKDLDEQVKDLLSYLECGSLFVYPEFSSLSQYQLFMEVVTDEIGWLDFYGAFSIIGHHCRKSNSTKQPLDANLLEFLLRSQSLLSVCLEDYWAAYDRSGFSSSEMLKIAERSASDLSLSSQRMFGGTNSAKTLEDHPKRMDLVKSGCQQLGLKMGKANRSAWFDVTTLADLRCSVESEPLHKTFLRKSTVKFISSSIDMWMGTQLLFIDIVDVMGLIAKQLRGYKITKRERRKIERTLADIASLIPITILMLIPVSAVGHAAMLAAIQKYMPRLIPTPYSPERLDIVKQLKRTKKMEIQPESLH
ncbi:hypothetical protein NMG60_11002562 [Bertholletia excelsa]